MTSWSSEIIVEEILFVPSRDQDRSDTMLVLVGCQYADGSRGCYRHITDGFALAICHTVATVLFISPTTANSLSAGTVNLCTALASHGACSHIAAIASTHIARLHNPSLSCAPASLPLFRPTLLEARIVRAPDPHQTIPDHNALWSKVTAWPWDANVPHFGYQLRA